MNDKTTPKERTPFQEFQALAKALVQVPKAELKKPPKKLSGPHKHSARQPDTDAL